MAGAPVETEIKLRVATAEAARRALARLGATLETARHFEDNVLFDDGDSSLAAQGHVLRLRRVGERAVLTYKGERRVVEGVKSREELEVLVSDAERFAQLLSALGFRSAFRYQKYREVYRHLDVEIVIDETPVGMFLEIEGPLEAIHRTAEALGYRRADYISESYAALFFAAGGKGDMVFPT